MYVDYHNHTVLCHHATGTVEEYLERARDLGIAEYGFAEHSYWMVRPDARNLCPSLEEMQTYFQWMDRAREQWDGSGGGPLLRVGLEADWVPDRIGEAKRFVQSYPFDYILGSVHHLQDPATGKWVSSWWFDECDLDTIYTTYFEEVAQLARSGLCDILAHLDVIRRSTRVPEKGVLPYVEAILPAIVESGVAVEINASGRDHLNGDFFPQEDVLRLLIEAGVPITFGSDAHAPTHVGRYASDVVELFTACGGREFMRFENRRMIPTPV
ncbi:MAG: histidinol-phosphatase family [Candidatus Sumerlaeota bacterium]|nr:histidinol-phosphatase family [Candidatus Sumerlaeota bacterium]